MEQSGQGSSERDVEAPENLFSPGPLYSPTARAHGTEGSVILGSLIDAQGCPGKAEVRQGLPHDLDHNATAAVRWWVFEPARADGRPVTVVYNVTIHFSRPGPGD